MKINVLDYLEDAVKECPEKRAVADENEAFSYSELRDNARRIGTYVAEHKKVPNGAVAVLIGRNARSVVTFLGCTYAGCFYVPIDSDFPEERLKMMVSDAAPELIINASGKEDKLFDSIDYEEIIKTTADDELLYELKSSHIDIDPLYAIFTSGSTGKPKCVLISHRSVIDLVEQFTETFQFSGELVFGNQAPFDFDVSVKDIYNSLKNKATVEIVPKKMFMMPKKLVEYIENKGINTLIWAVSALRIVADFKTLDNHRIESLKYVMFSGEKMPVKTLNYLMDNIPSARFVNLYGPTEITCNCTYYEIKERFKDDELLPIGKAFKNTQVMLVDEDGKIISEEGREGEICVSGTCLALGYLSDREKTDEKFIQSPVTDRFARLIYKTGDIGHYNSKHEIVFTSRRDYQIKHMGHRIELEGIETVINAIEDVDYGCCVYDEKNSLVYLFYQGKEKSPKEFAEELKKKLPKYMWPNRYVYIDKLPLNKNGKVDRKLLRENYIEKND